MNTLQSIQKKKKIFAQVVLDPSSKKKYHLIEIIVLKYTMKLKKPKQPLHQIHYKVLTHTHRPTKTLKYKIEIQNQKNKIKNKNSTYRTTTCQP